LKVIWALLVDEIALYNVGHIFGRHYISVVIDLTVGTEESSKIHLCDELATCWALLGSVVFV
jgi:hypothetical protein